MARGRAHARLLVQLSVRGRGERGKSGEVGGGQQIRKKLGEKNEKTECQAEPTTTHTHTRRE